MVLDPTLPARRGHDALPPDRPDALELERPVDHLQRNDFGAPADERRHQRHRQIDQPVDPEVVLDLRARTACRRRGHRSRRIRLHRRRPKGLAQPGQPQRELVDLRGQRTPGGALDRLQDHRLGHQNLVVQSSGPGPRDRSPRSPRDSRCPTYVGTIAGSARLAVRPISDAFSSTGTARDARPGPGVDVDQRRRGAVGQRADDPRLVGDQLVEDVVEELHLASAGALVQRSIQQLAHLGAQRLPGRLGSRWRRGRGRGLGWAQTPAARCRPACPATATRSNG